MKKQLFFIIVFFLFGQKTFAYYDFSVIAPTGQTLYYSINYGTNNVSVTYPGDGITSNYYGTQYHYYYHSTGYGNGYWFPKPADTLVIPDTITYSGTTYTVTGISEGAFYECDELTFVLISELCALSERKRLYLLRLRRLFKHKG